MPALEKDFDSWSQRNDYANSEELMVEITLAEYRELVTVKAKADNDIRALQLKLVDAEKKLAAANSKLLAALSGEDQEDKQ